MSEPRLHIAVACGGTGGHLCPGLATAAELKARGHRVTLWLTGKAREREAAAEWDGAVIDVPSEGFQFGWHPRSLLTVARLAGAVARGRGRMKKDRPDVVLAMGSYASVGPLAAARMLGVPIVLHEANVLPGRANALFARTAACVGVTFEETRHYLRGRRVVHTGMPLRRGLNPGRTEPPAFEGVLRLLVMGGSRGAHALNETLPHALARVQSRGHRVCVTHLAGDEDRDGTAARYGEAGVEHDTRAFCGDMDALYRMTHLAVCRAGASTCAELSAYGIPALFVPYPHATADHQTLNARQLEKRAAADIVAQDQLTPEWLADYLLSFFARPERLQRMSAASRGSGIGRDPAALADLVEEAGRPQP
ncbi:UDP-N-acetylglucosamine--N-acetylmuramyl-(pentapeptide) pyrophosphoryl-undecaprenol N-acetylglucosamine transferase [Kiritimatiella glycovorans]|uniref:UDP-N-acetylglucosamine--N-acetylmuramyl-(pentapeptide) pyrophosphoryl-undecaprenol N-acetylglucosamine transferase n=1 Tax=Kiritimatiella glycovorans TaxID=1307763 RepID=A0A0G3EG55_9BACT|nr:UDP-N-acetylglucosamine--N-acetylmuramyl-(pentapeptide) pyrophosphoryl-undecaprenol N-acetylglucosamine transferase [Kiritimatiella glycovorans]AKJ64377.1 UDP-N-acetylglucosamine--N-acetylmuramyl-(pentapeptide) pyrophosphoryl-undecaprenol N-acetylglucosamine transferase [Kiritimatiella glycovorans]